jgi:hypothetical protein
MEILWAGKTWGMSATSGPKKKEFHHLVAQERDILFDFGLTMGWWPSQVSN